MKTKQDLDREVARLLGVPQKKVSDITTVYVEVLKQELLERGEVRIHTFGRLSVRFERTGKHNMMGHARQPTNCRVHFSKSTSFKARIERHFDGKRR